MIDEVKVNKEIEEVVWFGFKLQEAIRFCRSSSDTKLIFMNLFVCWEKWKEKFKESRNEFYELLSSKLFVLVIHVFIQWSGTSLFC